MSKPLIFTTASHGGSHPYSNASPFGFRLDGARWPSVERYLLAQRYAGTPLADAVRLAPSAAAADALARASGLPMREGWAEAEGALMDRALLAKFRAYPTLRAGLLATGDRPLVEAPVVRPGVSAWVSPNTLGFALMRVRSTLRRSEAQKRRRTGPAAGAGGP